MKLSEIEEVGYLLTAYDEEDVYDENDINYDVFEFHRDKFTQNDLNKCGLTQWDFCDCQALYTADQMQEYAKAKVFEALGKYGVRDDEWSDHEAKLAYKQMTKFIFEEDTKND